MKHEEDTDNHSHEDKAKQKLSGSILCHYHTVKLHARKPVLSSDGSPVGHTEN